jgi:rod shape-determining protein MreC
MLRTSRTDRTIVVAAVVILAGIALTIMHVIAARHNRPDIVTNVVRNDLLAPSMRAKHRFGLWARQRLIDPARAQRLAAENARLKQKIAALTIENEELRDQANQIDVLRKMVKLPATLPWDLRAGLVISLKPSPVRDNAIVALGAGKHAAKQDVVLGPTGGLVGQVVQVHGSVCDVLLITDPESSVGARVLPSGRAQAGPAVCGICQGMRDSLVSLVDMPVDADVQVGDKIYTSGLGEIFPKGIPIGTVTSVHADPTRSLKSATVSTIDDFNLLDEVFVRQ